MEALGALGGLLVVLFLIFIGILAFFAPLFLWRIHVNVKHIRQLLETTMSNKGRQHIEQNTQASSINNREEKARKSWLNP